MPDVEAHDDQLRLAVDAAYSRKYGAGAGRMVFDAAAATTLRLDRQVDDDRTGARSPS